MTARITVPYTPLQVCNESAPPLQFGSGQSAPQIPLSTSSWQFVQSTSAYTCCLFEQHWRGHIADLKQGAMCEALPRAIAAVILSSIRVRQWRILLLSVGILD
jgi:hypothetical protein